LLFGWLLHSRLGQWIAVVIGASLLTPFMALAGWPPVLALLGAGILIALMIAAFNRQIHDSPLGDILSAVGIVSRSLIELIRGFGDIWR